MSSFFSKIGYCFSMTLVYGMGSYVCFNQKTSPLATYNYVCNDCMLLYYSRTSDGGHQIKNTHEGSLVETCAISATLFANSLDQQRLLKPVQLVSINQLCHCQLLRENHKG